MRYLALLMTSVASIALAADSYSPDADRDYPINVYWGDTHVHTSYSSGDANIIGQNRVTPTVAYRFARGEPVLAGNGMVARINKPLDFLVIADHAEGLGVVYEIQAEHPQLAQTESGQKAIAAWQNYQASGGTRAAVLEFRDALREPLDPNFRSTVWRRVIERAEEFNDPGNFTALIGYEWTSAGSVPGVFGNLHRVVIFADGASRTSQITPFAASDSRNPEDLWAFLKGYKTDTGGDVIAIPHNPNLSNGEMFARHQYDGSELTASWAKLRNEIEPLVEATQLKGDSEAHPILSPTDEFADFETWHSWAGYVKEAWKTHPCCDARNDPSFDDAAFARQKQAEYVRPALKAGLDLGVMFGINPFKYGIIGSTDSHASFASADEDNYWGQYPNTPPSATRSMERYVPTWERPMHWETGASGYAAVWAHENTRESIFAAMKRREVYATTGPRITVRMFAGWDFDDADALAPNVARVGYAKGVPMGADLENAPGDAAPTFLLAALRDPDGANLDRIQIVKGWRDSDGELHERVYDVALSDGRKPRRRVQPVGSTVDVENASYSNEIGDPELKVVWRDPDFDSEEHAFYYARVIEIPTPRWPAYEAKYFGAELPDEVVVTTQDRAYTSPIWYSP